MLSRRLNARLEIERTEKFLSATEKFVADFFVRLGTKIFFGGLQEFRSFAANHPSAVGWLVRISVTLPFPGKVNDKRNEVEDELQG